MESKQPLGNAYSYQRLIDLGPEKLAILEGLMAMAEPTPLLVDLVQKEWGLCLDVKPDTLRRQISRYRNQMVTPKMAMMLVEAEKGGGKEGEKYKELFVEQLNMLEEYTDLYQLQKQRIQKGILAEKELKTLDKSLGFEIEVTRKLAADILNLHFELGIMRRAAKTKTGVVVNADGSQSSFTVVEESRVAKVQQKMQQFLEFIDGELTDDESVSSDPDAVGVDPPNNHEGSQSQTVG